MQYTVEGKTTGNGHSFWYDEDGGRCGRCDTRPSGIHAQWPCGVAAPRMVTASGFNVPMTPAEWAAEVRNRTEIREGAGVGF